MKPGIWIALLVLAGLAAVVMMRSGGVAPMPAVFGSGTALNEAIEQSETTGKPVFALVTADWCGPCQALKKNTLSDARVAAWIEANTIPVYIDSDANPEDARRLGVSGIPASFVLKGEAVLGKQVGYADAGEYLAFLEQSVSGG